MAQVSVVTDSGADLAGDLVARLDVTIVPLVVRFGTQVYLDGQLSADQFWQKVAEGPHHPGTSQPAVGVFEDTFGRLVEAGRSVLCLTITSRHSGTFNSASTAAQRFGDKVRVMDTLSLSLGQGFQVLEAAKAAVKGWGLGEIARLVAGVRTRTHLFILLDTLEYVRRGGRADLLIPLLDRVSRTLTIKPILTLIDGQLALHALARSYQRGLIRIRQEIARRRPLERLGAIHVRGLEAASEMARALSEELDFSLEEIAIAEAGPALSAHGGPRALGVAFLQRAG